MENNNNTRFIESYRKITNEKSGKHANIRGKYLIKTVVVKNRLYAK